jgi:hypothetical protein
MVADTAATVVAAAADDDNLPLGSSLGNGTSVSSCSENNNSSNSSCNSGTSDEGGAVLATARMELNFEIDTAAGAIITRYVKG